jgi:hypothetical protein
MIGNVPSIKQDVFISLLEHSISVLEYNVSVGENFKSRAAIVSIMNDYGTTGTLGHTYTIANSLFVDNWN